MLIFERVTPESRYVITLIDIIASGQKCVSLCMSITTSAVTKFPRPIQQKGVPEGVLTDNGTRLVSHEYNGFLSYRGIKHQKCSLYYPQSNDGVERFNGVLKSEDQTCIHTGKPGK